MSYRKLFSALFRLIVALIFCLPLLWMISAAFQPRGAPLPNRLAFWPSSMTVDNFLSVWRLVPMGRFILNSIMVITLAVPLTVLIGSWAGFSMARLPQKSQRRWILISLAVMMVPGIALWATRFLVFRELGWYDTVWALIAPAWMGTSPFYVLMFYRAFRRIPTALYDAARLDGAGVWGTWSLIAFPIARPTVYGVALLSFVFYWSDFISPLLYLRSEQNYTLPVALQLIQQLNRSDWPLLMAAAVIATAIPVLLFLLSQPYFSRLAIRD